jgi:hypothetical protein
LLDRTRFASPSWSFSSWGRLPDMAMWCVESGVADVVVASCELIHVQV